MDMNLSKFQEIVKDRGVWHAAVKAPVPWPPDGKSRLIGKDPGAGNIPMNIQD